MDVYQDIRIVTKHKLHMETLHNANPSNVPIFTNNFSKLGEDQKISECSLFSLLVSVRSNCCYSVQ